MFLYRLRSIDRLGTARHTCVSAPWSVGSFKATELPKTQARGLIMQIYSRRSARVAASCAAGLFTCTLSSMSAVAAPPVLPLTVEVQGDGSVDSQPAGINCPADCTGSYRKSSSVTLSAIPGPDSRFLEWTGACAGAQPTCEVKIRNATYVAALFEKTPNTEITAPAAQETSLTNEQTTSADNSTVQTIQIGWPVFSGNN